MYEHFIDVALFKEIGDVINVDVSSNACFEDND